MMRNLRGLLASFVCGAVLVLAFAPFGFAFLAPLSLAALFLLIQAAPAKQAFLRGLAFGYGLYGVGVSWVYVSLSTYGGMPFWMGSIAVLGFAGILALFIAIPAFLSARLWPEYTRHRLLALPALWLVFEWMKSWVLTGFPWLDIGYTQTSTWLLGWAPIGGVYLVTLMVLIIATSIAWSVRHNRIAALTVIPLVLAMSWLLDQRTWSKPGTPVVVGVVQANVPINNKWRPLERDRLIQTYRSLSNSLQSTAKLDLVVWPETALPLHMQRTDSNFWQALGPNNVALLTGIVDAPSLNAPTPSYDESYNAAVLLCDGETQLYRKRHLVPFGEYMPLRFLFGWVLDYLELPMSDFSSWQGIQPLTCGDSIKIGLSICYEDAFADEYRSHVGDATILVNISEDAWFGDSFAPHQRLQMAQMRARELSRPMVRSANSGPSAFIDERGKVLKTTPQFNVAMMSHEVIPHTGDTPYKRFGDWIVYLSLLALGAGLISGRRS